jgi:Rieske [2Fe-2S] domain
MTRVIALDLAHHNAVLIDDELYVIRRTTWGKTMLVPDHCPHRGGPLRLGWWDHRTGRLVCPWHENKIPQAHFQRSGIPLLISGATARAVVDVPAQTRVVPTKVTILDEPPPCTASRAAAACAEAAAAE